MDKGIYCLVFENPACSVRVGALGDIPFAAGWHVYVGSALGSGGLKRLERHIVFAKGRDRRPTWHVDFLLASPHFLLSSAVFAGTTNRLECLLVETIGGEGIAGFGCSDCACRSHLMYRTSDPQEEITVAFLDLGLSPVIKTIMRNETKRNL